MNMPKVIWAYPNNEDDADYGCYNPEKIGYTEEKYHHHSEVEQLKGNIGILQQNYDGLSDDCRELKEENKLLRNLLGKAPDIHEDETLIGFMNRFDCWVKQVKQALEGGKE